MLAETFSAALLVQSAKKRLKNNIYLSFYNTWHNNFQQVFQKKQPHD